MVSVGSDMVTRMAALEGVRVADLSGAIGAYATKLLGDLGVGSTTNVNVLVMPAYVELRLALMDALGPYPEVRQSVARVLHQLESKAADTIKPKEFPNE